MRQALEEKRLPWWRTMIILPGTESRSRPGMVRPDGRTDIPILIVQIFVRSGEHDPHAIIECKRVAEGSRPLVREYVVEGIDRFCTGKYGANHRTGFMVGYVTMGAAGVIVNEINAFLANHERIAEQLAKSDRIPFPHAWMSNHPRTNSYSPIELHHSMFPLPAA
jgi:hypothetical protein